MKHDPERAQAATRTAFVGAVSNLLLTGVKLVGGILGQSHALIADAIHSLSDLLSDLLVWFAGRHASEAPDTDHPYGHRRYETAATLALGSFLILIALGIGWDAIERLFTPSNLLSPGYPALAAAVVSIFVKEWLYWWTLGYANRVRSEMLRANAWHHRSDAVSSIVVLVGVAGTMAGLPYLDAIAAVLVALMIAKIGIELGWEALNELVDTGLERDKLAAIRQTITNIGGVRGIHMLRTRRYGGDASADVHVLVDPRVSVSEGHLISQYVEDRLKDQIDEIIDVTVHIDPEDDQKLHPCANLPLRTEALAVLATLWANVEHANQRTRVMLHYLNGRIDVVEAFFPLTLIADEPARAQRLRSALQGALESDSRFNRVEVYFG